MKQVDPQRSLMVKVRQYYREETCPNPACGIKVWLNHRWMVRGHNLAGHPRCGKFCPTSRKLWSEAVKMYAPRVVEARWIQPALPLGGH